MRTLQTERKGSDAHNVGSSDELQIASVACQEAASAALFANLSARTARTASA